MIQRWTLAILALLVATAALWAIREVRSQRREAALCVEVGSRLEQSIRKDARFADVAVLVTTHPRVVISAPADLLASAKADLERIVAAESKPLVVHINYAPSIESYPSPAPRSPKTPNHAMQRTAPAPMRNFRVVSSSSLLAREPLAR